MDEIHGRAALQVDATPQAVFDLITDVNRLPEWNIAIERVLERPPELAEGVEWTIKMHPPRTLSWTSISRVEELDRQPPPLRLRDAQRRWQPLIHEVGLGGHRRATAAPRSR